MLGNLPSEQRWLPSPLAIIRWLAYLSIPMAAWLSLNYATLREYFAAQGRLAMHQRELTKLEERKRELAEQKRDLEKGGFAAEKAARETWHMIQPGEHVIYIEPEPGMGAPVAAVPDVLPNVAPNEGPIEAEEDKLPPEAEAPPPETPVEEDLHGIE